MNKYTPMKTTDNFKKVIAEKLQEIAQNDPLFANSFNKENKNIDDCITYVLNQVQNSGCNGFADDEIFGMAMHYYDEDSLEIGSPIKCNVIVNRTIELTPEEIEQAKTEAREKLISKEIDRLQKKVTPKKAEPKVTVNPQQSLF